MSETAKRSGVQLDGPGGRDTVVAFPDELFSHLHFDRRARAWRSPDEIVPETVDNAEQNGALQMRCA
jgi:hypothetical protein